MKRNRLNPHSPSSGTSGYTIVEVMFAMAVAAVTLAGAVSLTSLSVNSNRETASLADQTDLASTVQDILHHAKACTANLVGQQLNTATFQETVVGLAYPKPDPADPNNVVKGDPVIGPDRKFGKVDVDDFKLSPFAQLSADTWLARLRVRTTKTRATASELSNYADVFAHVKVDGANKITECLEIRDTKVIPAEELPLKEKICSMAVEGGTTYDPVKDICEPKKVTVEEPAPEASFTPGKLSEEVCNQLTGGNMGYDEKNDKCVAQSFAVKGSLKSCTCPTGSKVTVDIYGRAPNHVTPPELCTQYDDIGQGDCPLPAVGKPDPANNGGTCSWAAGVNLTGAYCECHCRGKAPK